MCAPRCCRFPASRVCPRAQERRQHQKARQAAAKEALRRNATTAADNPTERHTLDDKQEARRQPSIKQETPSSDVISTPNEDTPGVPLTRPRLSSARKVDRDKSNHKDRGPADIDSREGAWGGGVGARMPTSGPARIASPAVRSFSRRSNRKLVRNAINFLCLAGGHLQEKKTRALEVRECLVCDGACEERDRCRALPTVGSLAYHLSLSCRYLVRLFGHERYLYLSICTARLSAITPKPLFFHFRVRQALSLSQAPGATYYRRLGVAYVIPDTRYVFCER